MKSERELFEAECVLLNYRGNMSKPKDGNFYFDETTNWMWQMWLSSKNRQGYKLVPVEATCKMIQAGSDCIWFENKGADDAYKAMIGAVDD